MLPFELIHCSNRCLLHFTAALIWSPNLRSPLRVSCCVRWATVLAKGRPPILSFQSVSESSHAAAQAESCPPSYLLLALSRLCTVEVLPRALQQAMRLCVCAEHNVSDTCNGSRRESMRSVLFLYLAMPDSSYVMAKAFLALASQKPPSSPHPSSTQHSVARRLLPTHLSPQDRTRRPTTNTSDTPLLSHSSPSAPD